MGQSDGMGGTLKRIAIQVGNDPNKGWYRFQVNPTQYKYNKPHRVTIFKTKSNIITEDFGKDIETIQFSGTTGFRVDSRGKNGADRLKELEEIIDNYAKQGGNGNRSSVEMKFYNFTDDKYFVVHLAPEGLSIERSAEQPLLFNYTLSLVVLREAGQPSERAQVSPQIGNVSPSIGRTYNAQQDTRTPAQILHDEYRRSVMPNTAVNPAVTSGAYNYGVNELKKIIGYGG
ncbi:hypothetical protein [Enterococcus phage vB_EfaH_149]|uniref:Uncharacterized protein n=4 Tax=Kochikohdavirus TaxID=2560160 RepID=A0ACA9AT98_9CAUD|nr:virion structural protein [Enterococcus phage EFLK1]AZU99948.1 hypothetical protein vBEfaHEF1TV_104 [Enterococcus phage vB_EfaH_EF1TV]QVW27929.1 hypothetical protein [Enterococcus phage MDA2]UYB00786.1 hypothetical protein GMNKNHGO_00166 [Enterococcus phage vB_Efa29212_3e]WDQ27667.1 hypothetical protein EF53_035 [Enterococcus phage 53]CAD0299957.1 Phage protein [Enterococcus phage 156]CAD0300009.1 hypothetical protein [Enterococcus phage vB_EfaH_149]DAG90133.1 MAG TPA: hypothetical protei